MKNSIKSISLILAAGAAGVAFFQAANSAFIAALPNGTLAAIGLSAAFVGLAAYDYSRRYQPLTLPTRVLRPMVPCTVTRSAAFSSKSACDDRMAA